MATLTNNDLKRVIATGEHPQSGCIRIWNDETGKPGEMEYSIVSVDYKDADRTFILELGNNEKVIAYEAEGITMDDRLFSVKNAKKVSWFQSNIEVLSYSLNGNTINARSAIPFKHFSTSSAANALEVYQK